MDIKECVEKLERSMSDVDRSIFMSENTTQLFNFHHSLGQLMRNECGLWKDDGLDAIKNDLETLHHHGIVVDAVTYLEYQGKANADTGTDYSLNSADNISGVVMEIYHDILNDRMDIDEMEYNDMIILEVCPFTNGKYFGDDIKQWLLDNMKQDQYKIIVHHIAGALSMPSYPRRFAFVNEEDATAFKLRWL